MPIRDNGGNVNASTRVEGTGANERPSGGENVGGGQFATRPGSIDANQVGQAQQQAPQAQQASQSQQEGQVQQQAPAQQQTPTTFASQPIARTESNTPQTQARPQQAAVPVINTDSVYNAQKQPPDAISAGFKQETQQMSAGTEDAPQSDSRSVLADLDLQASGLARRQSYEPQQASLRLGENDSTQAVRRRRDEGKPSGDRPVGSNRRMQQKSLPVEDKATESYIKSGGDLFPKAFQQTAKKTIPNYRSKNQPSVVKKLKSEIKAKIGGKKRNAQAAYGKLLGDTNVPMGYVSVGSAFIDEALAIPGNQLVEYIQQQTGIQIGSEQQLVDLLRNNSVEVGVFKSPDLEPESSCKLLLRVHNGADIRMHPLMFKKFNADTDGDDACVSFWPNAIERCPDPVRYLVNLAGDLTVDPDFFPFYKAIGGIVTPTQREAIREAIHDNVTVDGHMIGVIERMFFSPGEHGKALEAFFREAYSFCSKRGEVDSAMLNGLLTRTYGALSMINRVAGGYGRDHYPTAQLLDGFRASTENDRKLLAFTEQVLEDSYVKASGTANFQDLRAMMRDYLGEKPGTNPAFRFTANVAKMFVNVDTRVQIGSEYEVGGEELLQGVLKFVESRKISEALSLGNRAKDAKEIMRERIIRRIGMLPDGNNSLQFIDRFIKVYEAESSLMHAANVSISVDAWTIEQKSSGGKIKLIDRTAGSVARCLRDVYGNSITVANLLGDAGLGYDPKGKGRQTWTEQGLNVLTAEYGSWTLDRFAKSNKFWESGRDGAKDKDAGLYHDGRIAQDAAFKVIKALANMRTSTASAYNRAVFESNDSVCEKLLTVFRAINSRDELWGDYLDRMVELCRLTDPEVYAYFGMDNVNGFLESKYGKAFLAARTTQQVASIRLAMTTECRLANIHGLIEQRDAMVDGNAKCVPAQIERIQDDIIAEQNLLGSSSWVWNAIILDTRMYDRNEMDRPFLRLKQGRETVLPMKNYKEWTSGKLDKYDTLEEVLLDISLSKNEKCDIVSDVVRVYEGFLGFSSYEVPEQLEKNEQAAYSSLAPTSVGIMSATNDFNKEYEKTVTSMQDAYDEVDDAYEQYGSTTKLTESLEYWADHPESYVAMGSDVLADAMCSILDPTYEQSEKSKQHPWTNALYTALSLVRNGGVFSDVYRTDDRAIGLVPMDKVSPYDIVCVLAGKKELTAYDSEGKIVRLTRDSVIGVENATEQDLWDFLYDNPNVAGALRPHSVNVSADGQSWMGATGNLRGFIEQRPEDDAKQRLVAQLADDPRFGALVALFTPTQGKTSLDLREDYEANIDQAIDIFAKADSVEQVMNQLGLNGDMPFAELNLDPVEANRLHDLIQQSIEDFLKFDFEGYVPSLEKRGRMHYDLSSCYAYYSVRQELSGAKTATSTGVEGDESWRTAAPITSLDIVDSYADLSQYDDGSNHEELIGLFGDCWTSLGKKVSEFTDLDWGNASNVVVELPEGMRHLDKSIDNDGPQVPSVYAYLLTKRDFSAENLNLKAKKTGDDGLHSVTKHGKYYTDAELSLFDLQSDDYQKILDQIRSMVVAEVSDTLNDAKYWLANRLKQANEICKYDNLTLADCMNFADLMIVVEDGEVRLRSVAMVCAAIRSKMSYGLCDYGTRSEVTEVARAAAAEAGSVDGNINELLHGFRRRAYSIMGGNPLIRPRSSSAAINASKLVNISKATKLPIANAEQHRLAVANPSFYAKNQKSIHDTEKGLNYKGDYFVAGYNDIAPMCVGPQAVWVFSYKPTNEQLRQAYMQGVTVLAPERTKWATPIGEKFVTPMFSRLLQGGYDYSSNPKFGVFRRPADNLVVLYESRLNEYDLTDAGIQLFDSLTDRLDVNWSDQTDMPIENMFANTFAAYPDAQYSAHLVTQEELRLILEGNEDITIDVGLAPEARDFDKHWQSMMNAIDKYVENFVAQGQQFKPGGILGEGAPGEVIGFMALEIHEPGFIGPTPTVYAPIIPFDMTGANGVSRAEVPAHFEISAASYEGDSTASQSHLHLEWKFDDDLANHDLKFFEGQTAANKFYSAINQSIAGPELRDGTKIDCAVAAASTSSRRVGSNRRLGTMQTLMMIARKNGYNFAEADGAFPGDPQFTNENGEQESIKERLAHGYLSKAEWASVFDGNEFSFDFVADPNLNSWIKDEVRRYAGNGGNITDYLACEFDGAHTDIWWEFECMFKTSKQYQDGLMSFLNMMDERLCAKSADDASEGYLFRCSPDDGGEGTHCMQMQVPIDDGDGGIYYSWENIFASWSFFNFNDFTGKSRPNVNGFCDALDAVQTHALSGLEADDKTWRQMLRRSITNMAEYKQPKFGVDVVDYMQSNDIEEE